MIKDRMGIYRKSKTDVPDYGSLFLIKEGKNAVNEYGGSDSADVEKLALVANAAYGSTCLLTDGTLYRKEVDGWNAMGEETTTTNETPTPTVIDNGSSGTS